MSSIFQPLYKIWEKLMQHWKKRDIVRGNICLSDFNEPGNDTVSSFWYGCSKLWTCDWIQSTINNTECFKWRSYILFKNTRVIYIHLHRLLDVLVRFEIAIYLIAPKVQYIKNDLQINMFSSHVYFSWPY